MIVHRNAGIMKYSEDLLMEAVLQVTPPGCSVIDVGAGLKGIYQKALAKRASRYVMLDAHAPYLAANKVEGPYVEKIVGVVPDALSQFGDQEFDTALVIDLLEHLELLDALGTVGQLKSIASTVAMFIPEGIYEQREDVYHMGADSWQTHRGTWFAPDVEALGFGVEVWDGFHSSWRKPGQASGVMWAVWRK